MRVSRLFTTELVGTANIRQKDTVCRAQTVRTKLVQQIHFHHQTAAKI